MTHGGYAIETNRRLRQRARSLCADGDERIDELSATPAVRRAVESRG